MSKIDEFNELKTEIVLIHTFGAVKAGVYNLSPDEASVLKASSEPGKDLKYVDSFLRGQGLNNDSRWSILDSSSSLDIFSDVVSRGLEDNSTSPNIEKAQVLAEQFIDLFKPDSRLLLSSGLLFAQWKLAFHRRIRIANGELTEKGLPKNSNLSPEVIESLRSQTISAVDGGIVGFDGSLIAYVWFADKN